MSLLIIIAISMAIKTAQSVLSWVVPKSPLFSSARSGMCVGYFDETISIIGGFPSGRDIVEYDLVTNQYTQHTSVLSGSPVYSSEAQQYTQIGHMMYIYHYFNYYDGSYIASYNLQTKSYNTSLVQKKYSDVYMACLTHISTAYLVVLGGRFVNGLPRTDVEILSLSQNVWITNGPSMTTPRAYFTCNMHADTLWSIGGYNNGIHLDSVETLYVPDINAMYNNAWNMMADSLSLAREKLRSVVHHDLIYVIGGYQFGGTTEAQPNVDVIDTYTRTIIQDTNLRIPVWDSAPIVVPNVHTLFVFGGFNRSLGEVQRLKTMQTSLLPTYAPTLGPSNAPSNPTGTPSVTPTDGPTSYPTNSPSLIPTVPPSVSPTEPSKTPSSAPTMAPSELPSSVPSKYPTDSPTPKPTKNPTKSPTLYPSQSPTRHPTHPPDTGCDENIIGDYNGQAVNFWLHMAVSANVEFNATSSSFTVASVSGYTKLGIQLGYVNHGVLSLINVPAGMYRFTLMGPTNIVSTFHARITCSTTAPDPTIKPTNVPTKKPTTPSPTAPGALSCGESDVGPYNGVALNFHTTMPFYGELIFNASGSNFDVIEVEAFTYLGMLLETDVDHDGIVHLSNAPQGN
eukprot:840840_1